MGECSGKTAEDGVKGALAAVEERKTGYPFQFACAPVLSAAECPFLSRRNHSTPRIRKHPPHLKIKQ